jgi:predicted RND superfamily exporter protein
MLTRVLCSPVLSNPLLGLPPSPRSFAGFGAFCARHPFVVFSFGLAVLVLLSFGVTIAERETSLSELWVEKGTRLRDEKAYFEDKFGGLRRTQALILSDSNNPTNVLAPDNIRALIDVLKPVMTETETDLLSSTSNPSSISNPDQVVLESFAGVGSNGAARTFTQKDFCERPEVPAAYAPGQTFPSLYVAFVSCVFDSIGSSQAKLPTGWGIDRFPCTRTTVLDCFQEGEFDYPMRLKQLQNVQLTLAGVKQNANSVYTTCTNTVKASLPTAELKGAFDNMVSFFTSLGYWYRKSINSFVDANAVRDYIGKSIANNENENIGVAECIGIGLTGGTSGCCLAWSGSKIAHELLIGTPIYSAGVLSQATSTRVSINNYNHNHRNFQTRIGLAEEADRDSVADEWEDKLIAYFYPLWEKRADTRFASGRINGNLDLTFQMDKTPGDVVKEGTSGEVGLILAGYIILVVYASASLAKLSRPYNVMNAVYSRVMLAFGGVAVVAISTFSSFGLTALVGLDLSVASVNLVPFISLAIGVDDMFVMAHTMIHLHEEHDVETRMKKALGIAGPSVLLTSAANACAFFIASLTPIPAVQSFVLQMGMSVLLNLFALLFLFVPCMVWDVQRTNSKLSDICIPPCMPLHGRVPDEWEPAVQNRGNIVAVFARDKLGPALTSMTGKIIVLVFAVGFCAGMAILGFSEVEKGLRLSDIALRGSYLRDFVEVNEVEFGSYDGFLVTPSIEYENQQANINLAMDNLQFGLTADGFSHAATQIPFPLVQSMRVKDLAWFADGASSFIPQGQPFYSSSAFYTAFQAWASTSGVTQADNLYCEKPTGSYVECSEMSFANGDRLKATRIQFIVRDLIDNEQFVEAIEQTRRRVDNSAPQDTMFVYGWFYQFWEQYLDIEANMMKVVGFSLLGVFVATFVLQFSWLTSIIIVMMILTTVVELYGLMVIIGAKLNAFSLTNLAMATGMAVEFTAHIAHVFLLKQGARTGTRDERVIESLEEMFPPMLNGALSSFLAVIPLIFARFPFFRTYYFGMFALMIIVAFVNGMIVLPVVLSLIGPRAFQIHNADAGDRTGGMRYGSSNVKLTETASSASNADHIGNEQL